MPAGMADAVLEEAPGARERRVRPLPSRAGLYFLLAMDVLQSPDALRNAVNSLRPGAWIAAGGGKWAAPMLVGLNLLVRMLHAPYVRSFSGFGRPWRHLEPLVEDVRVRELGFGCGYIMTGQTPCTSWATGCPDHPAAH